MLKVLGFLTKRAGMEMQAFIDYYENTHVPLICTLGAHAHGLQTPIPCAGRRTD